MKPTVIIVVGLPGAGKTTYMKRLLDEGAIAARYDDYQAGSREDDRNPRLAKCFPELIATLQAGKTVAVSDIRYCRQTELLELIAAIAEAVPKAVFDIRYFENDPERCAANVRARARPNLVERELQLIREYSAGYAIPSGAPVLEVYRGD